MNEIHNLEIEKYSLVVLDILNPWLFHFLLPNESFLSF